MSRPNQPIHEVVVSNAPINSVPQLNPDNLTPEQLAEVRTPAGVAKQIQARGESLRYHAEQMNALIFPGLPLRIVEKAKAANRNPITHAQKKELEEADAQDAKLVQAIHENSYPEVRKAYAAQYEAILKAGLEGKSGPEHTWTKEEFIAEGAAKMKVYKAARRELHERITAIEVAIVNKLAPFAEELFQHALESERSAFEDLGIPHAQHESLRVKSLRAIAYRMALNHPVRAVLNFHEIVTALRK